MKVSSMQEYLQGMVTLLNEAGGKKVADEVQQMIRGLDCCRDLTIREFADFLASAKVYRDTGIIPARAKTSRSRATSDPEAVTKAVAELESLYEQSIDASVSYSTIEIEVRKLNKLSAPTVKEVAKGFGVPTPKSKKGAIESILQKISDRKESFQRTAF